MASERLLGALFPLLFSAQLLGVRTFRGRGFTLWRLYSACFFLFMCTSALLSVFYTVQEVKNSVVRGDSVQATTRFVAISVMIGVFLSSASCVHFTFTKEASIRALFCRLETASILLDCDVSGELRSYIKLCLIIFWPLCISETVKEVLVYYEDSVFYAIGVDSLLVLARGSFAVLELEMLAVLFANYLLCKQINLQLQRMACLTKPLSAARLETLRRVNGELTEIGEDTTGVFSSVLLPCVFTLATDCAQGAYFTAISFFVGTPDIGLSLDSFCWSMICMFQIIFLAATCHYIASQAAATSNKLHKLEVVTRDDKVRDELSLFATQLLLRPAPHFSVYGIFTLDMNLVASILGAICTYSVILLQFHTLSTCESAPPARNPT